MLTAAAAVFGAARGHLSGGMMNETQRAAALRLADTLSAWPDPSYPRDAAALLRELAAEPVQAATQADLHLRSVEIMSAALAYSERMTVAMEMIASVANDWRGGIGGNR